MRWHHASLLLALALGCGSRPNTWEVPQDVVGPVVAGSELVWLNRTSQVAEVLDPSGAHAPLGLDVQALPRALAPTPTGFLVSGGRGDGPGLDLVRLPEGTRTRLPVAGAYDRIRVSPDGRFAVLFFDPAAPPAPGGPLARNNNEVTVVDLSAPKATVTTLGTESLAPEDVVFSPDPQLAALVLDGTIVLLTLDRPELQVQVPLKLPDGTVLHPQQVLFAPDGRYLYVRAIGSDDVLALDVLPGPDGLHSAVNFLFFPGASGLVDLAVPQGPGFERYVAALYAGTGPVAALLDATGDTSRTHSVSLTSPGARLSDLGNGTLLISSPSSTAVVGWEPLLDRFDQDALAAQGSGEPLLAAGHAFFVHDSVTSPGGQSAALTGLALLDDGARLRVHQSPLVLGAAPTGRALDAASGTLLLAVPVAQAGSGAAPLPTTSGRAGSIVTVRADTLAIGGFALDDEVSSLGVAGSFGFAVHPSSLGDVTFFPLANPGRASARRVVGFLGGHLLDRGETP